MPLNGFAKSVVGSREANQDAFLCWVERGLFAVADGVGGGLKGEVASQMSIEGLKKLPEGSNDLKSVFESIQAAVLKEAMESLGDALMGSTLTAVLVRENEAKLCHVGDSRCYLWAQGVLKTLTVDHEVYDESFGGPVLASYMGIPSDVHPLTIQEDTIPLSPGNRLLLCSDGLYKQVPETKIAELLNQYANDPIRLLDTLCQEAEASPYSDNVTIVYVEIA